MSQSLPERARALRREQDSSQVQEEIRNGSIRRNYREMDIALTKVDMNAQKGEETKTLMTLNDYLSGADENFKGVSRSNEAVRDVAVVSKASHIAKVSTRNLELGSAVSFNMQSFIEKARGKIETRAHELIQQRRQQRTALEVSSTAGDASQQDMDEDILIMGKLEYLGMKAFDWMSIAPSTDFLVGPMSVEYSGPRQRTHARRQTQAVGEASKVGVIDMDDVKTGGVKMTQLIRDIYNILMSYEVTESQPVGLYEFALNPTSFSQSIENMFYISFLVKDGKIGVAFDEDSVPVIFPIPIKASNPEEEEAETQRRRREPTKQIIFDLDMDTWQNLIKIFEINEPIIPTRPKVVENNEAGAWYSG